jgi:hypothetical protein
MHQQQPLGPSPPPHPHPQPPNPLPPQQQRSSIIKRNELFPNMLAPPFCIRFIQLCGLLYSPKVICVRVYYFTPRCVHTGPGGGAAAWPALKSLPTSLRIPASCQSSFQACTLAHLALSENCVPFIRHRRRSLRFLPKPSLRLPKKSSQPFPNPAQPRPVILSEAKESHNTRS